MDHQKRVSFLGAGVLVLTMAASFLAGPSLLNATPAITAGCPLTHYVTWGETLYRIGLKYNIWWTDIAVANNLNNPNRIYVGQKLIIPCAAGQQPTTPTIPTTVTPAAPTFNPNAILPYDPKYGPPKGCYLSDGNACYGAGTCFTDQDWRRGKETCLGLGLGTNLEPITTLPIIHAGRELIVDGTSLGGFDTGGGHVCGMLIIHEGQPTVLGSLLAFPVADLTIIEAKDAVRIQMAQWKVDCSGGYIRAHYGNGLGALRGPS